VPPPPGYPRRGTPYSEVTGLICRVPSTSFSQSPRYILPVHPCRFGVRFITLKLFPGSPRLPAESNYHEQLSAFVTLSKLRNINLIPIDYVSRPRLRGRLTLRGLTLRRNPWTFGGSVSHTALTLLMSAFSLLIPPALLTEHLHRLTERSATPHPLT
jgi:hypothetical protein